MQQDFRSAFKKERDKIVTGEIRKAKKRASRRGVTMHSVKGVIRKRGGEINTEQQPNQGLKAGKLSSDWHAYGRVFQLKTNPCPRRGATGKSKNY